MMAMDVACPTCGASAGRYCAVTLDDIGIVRGMTAWKGVWTHDARIGQPAPDWPSTLAANLVIAAVGCAGFELGRRWVRAENTRPSKRWRPGCQRRSP